MPNYRVITLADELLKMEKEIEAERAAGQYEGNKDTWDKEILREVAFALTDVEANLEMHTGYVAAIRLDCKGTFERWAERVRQPARLQQADIGAVAGDCKRLLLAVKEAHAAQDAVGAAMRQFREEGWVHSATAGLSDPDKLAPYRGGRKMAIERNKADLALIARCEEYARRVAEFAKQVVQAVRQGAVEVAEYKAEIAALGGRIAAGKKEIDDGYVKAKGTLERLEQIAKKSEKAYSQEDLAAVRLLFPNVAPMAKTARGRLKTLRIEMDGLELRAGRAGPGWKEEGLKAVKDAAALFKEAADLVALFNRREAKVAEVAAKVLKVMAKAKA